MTDRMDGEMPDRLKMSRSIEGLRESGVFPRLAFVIVRDFGTALANTVGGAADRYFAWVKVSGSRIRYLATLSPESPGKGWLPVSVDGPKGGGRLISSRDRDLTVLDEVLGEVGVSRG